MFNDELEYLEYTSKGVLGKLTRGVVMGLDDPLFAGRVRVWIPTLHNGWIPSTETEDGLNLENGFSYTASQYSSLAPMDSINDAANEFRNSLLPWAQIVSFNWGTVGNPVTGYQEKGTDFGLFNVPKIGTEVWIIFEDDDPDKPLIIGAINHQDKFFSTEALTPLELGAGLKTFEESDNNEKAQNYSETVAESYVIKSQKGSYFVLSEAYSKENIKLGAALSFSADTSSPSLPATQYDKFKTQYPNFPSTSTAPFRFTSLPMESATLLATPIPPEGDAKVIPTVEFPSSFDKMVPIQIPYPDPEKDPKRQKQLWADREGRLHTGIDLSAIKGTPVYAPIDGTIYKAYSSKSAGYTIFMQGADGWCHTFMHLDTIEPRIIPDVTNNKYTAVKRGQLLGTVGNTGTTSRGEHLHWEVFSPHGINIDNSYTISALQTAGAKGGTVKGINIIRYSIFVDPLRNWLKNNSNIVVTPAQLPSLNDSLSQVSQNKIIGLEMSLVAGGETVFLRHPSGAFLGFDADGNFKLFTPGDAYIKVNRSMIYDVLGGIMTTCLAMYTRVKSVYKLFAGIYKPPVTRYVEAEFPTEFKTVETSRLNDMIDAVKATSSNFYYSLVQHDIVKTLKEISEEGTLYADISSFSMDNYNTPLKPEYDAIVNSKFNTIIAKDTVASIQMLYAKKAITPDLIKALILVESNGDPTVRSRKNAIGLMQVTLPAVAQIKTTEIITPEYLLTFLDPKQNIEVGIYYFRYCLMQVMTKITKVYKQLNKSFVFDEDQAKEIVKIALLVYNAGESALVNFDSLLTRDQVPSYLSIEEDFYNRKRGQSADGSLSPGAKESLNYAPKVLFVYKNIIKSA